MALIQNTDFPVPCFQFYKTPKSDACCYGLLSDRCFTLLLWYSSGGRITRGATNRRNPQISHIREGRGAVTKVGGLLLIFQICAFAL